MYEVQPGRTTPCELVYIDRANKGGGTTTVLVAGTRTECTRVLRHIQHHRNRTKELQTLLKKFCRESEKALSAGPNSL